MPRPLTAATLLPVVRSHPRFLSYFTVLLQSPSAQCNHPPPTTLFRRPMTPPLSNGLSPLRRSFLHAVLIAFPCYSAHLLPLSENFLLSTPRLFLGARTHSSAVPNTPLIAPLSPKILLRFSRSLSARSQLNKPNKPPHQGSSERSFFYNKK